jgi:trk system potassium uptake protein TrkH
MNILTVFKVLGILLMFFSLIMVPPSIIGLIYNDGEAHTFAISFVAILVVGLGLWLPLYKSKSELKTRNGFLVVVLAWLIVGVFGALPFLISENTPLSITDAAFESFSGLTTTGATVLTGLDNLPPSILFYRQFLQWVGGIGIIVLAVAVLPLLGIGGMQLYRAEAPGPVKDNKLAPRIAETAKYLSYIYVSLTLFCCIAYWLAGMSFFDAICHAFSTTAIGGFSTHDASLGYFDNIYIEIVAAIFMMLSAINFSLHFTAWQQKNVFRYLKDPEFLFYIGVVSLVGILVCTSLFVTNTYETISQSLRFGLFQTVSILTTTGFSSTNFSAWQSFIPLMLIFAGFMGGCAGSTGGGIKAIRVLLLYKQFVREIKRLIHPSGVFAIKYGKSAISDRLIQAVWGFIGAYISIFLVMVIAMMMTGLDFESAFSAVAASLNNLGPGLGVVSSHYGDISDSGKWLLCFNMLLGRVEIFTLLVLFSPMFWQK